MPQDNNATDRVQAGTEEHRDRAFGFVTEWIAGDKTAKIKLADDSEWILAGDAINMYRDLIELSRDHKKPIFLAVDKRTQRIGIVFSTMMGTPELNGETVDGKEIQVSVPPSPRVFRLRKDRPWFHSLKTVLIDAQNPTDPTKPHKLWIAFDSVTSEIVNVSPASD